MWGNPTLFQRVKSIEKKVRKINIDIINSKKLFDISVGHK